MLLEEIGMATKSTFDLTEYLAQAHAITAIFGRQGESVSKIKYSMNH